MAPSLKPTWMTGFSRELQWLIDLLRSDFGDGELAFDDDIDAGAVVALADAHRLTIVAERNWRGLAARGLAPEPPAAFAECAARARTRALFAASHLVRLAQAFASAGVAWRSLKGPALSVQLYGDATMRMARDLDIIVPKAQLADAVAAAASAGWTAPAHWCDLMRITGRYEMELQPTTRGQPLLELHSALGPSYAQLELDPFTENAGGTVRIAAVEIPVLMETALATYVAWHGARGLWYRLTWLVDLARLLPAHETDALRLLEAARCHGAEPALRTGALLARRLFAVASPPWPAASPAVAARVDMMIRWSMERLRLGVDAPSVWSPPGSYRWLWREVAQQNNVWRSAACALYQVSRPTMADADRLGVSLPLALHQIARPYFIANRLFRRTATPSV